jgi:hypothetical protein
LETIERTASHFWPRCWIQKTSNFGFLFFFSSEEKREMIFTLPP